MPLMQLKKPGLCLNYEIPKTKMRNYITKSLKFLGIFSIVCFSNSYNAQTCVSVNAGPDVTICSPNCTTLTAIPVPSNATTSYSVAQIPYAPDPFTAGTAVALPDDGQTALIPLPFPFCYFGTVYNSFIIGSNGWVGFSATTSTWVINNPVPDASGASPRNCIMGPWQDINPSVGGTIRYQTYGVTPCRRLVVSYNAVPMYSCGTPATQQIVLYETTNIIDNFIAVKPLCATWNQGRAIQAIHNAAGNAAVVVPGRNSPTQWTANNEGRRYTPTGVNTYAVTWWNGPTQVGTGTSINVCPTITTTYTAQVVHTNCNNTTVTVTDQVIVNVSSLTVNVNPATTTICAGNNIQLNASATGATSYTWAPATGLNNPNIPNPIASPTTTTIYTVTASDGNCSGTATVTVNVTSLQNASAGPNVLICYQGSTQLNASGGVTYSWSPTTGLSNPNISNPTATPSATTTYTVTVTDASGCSGTATVTVTVNPQISLNTAGFSTQCSYNCTGQGVVIVSGGTGPFSYSWSNGGTNASINNLCPGTYTVTVTDASGCTASDTAIVSSPPPIVLNLNSTPANCGQPDGSISVSASGGVPGYTYLWTPGNYNTATVNNVGPNNYCVTVTDANGCTATGCVTVANTPGVQISISGSTNVTCFNACDGTANTTINGGTGPFNYTWAPSGGNGANATGLCAGTYTVTVTDANNCSSSTTVTITQPTQVSISPIAPITICSGACTNLNASGSGGTGTLTYVWNPGNLPGQQVQVCPTTTTTYTVTVTDANSCSTTSTVVVTVRPPLAVNANTSQAVVCPGVCATLTAMGSGGNGGPYTYSWAPGGMTGSAIQVCPSTTTTYTVTVSDNCTQPVSTGTVAITVNPPPVVAITTPVSSGCESPGFCTDFFTTTAATTYNWTFQGGNPSTSNVQNPSQICFANPGAYDVTLSIVDANGCSATTSVPGMITVHPDPVAAFTWSPTSPTALFGLVNFTDQSIGANQWQWFFDPNSQTATSNLQNPTYTYTDTGLYYVSLIAISPEGCRDTVVMGLEVKPDYTFFVPNAFTPNGDGRNDIFIPEGIYWDPSSYDFYVFDRWGMQIFHTNKVTEGWNGRVNNTGSSIVQQDVYVWKIYVKDNLGVLHQYVGHVSVIR
jgi:gliding motility-associated-like protein